MRNTNTARQYLANPFSPLYNSADFTISDADWIEQLLEQVLDIERSLHCEEELGYIVNQIKFLQLSFVRQGLYYWCIKHRKLYKNTHANFKAYCQEILGKTHWAVNECIEAARIVITLITQGFARLPKHISQCLVLAKLPDEDAIAQGWRKVLDMYADFEITADKIELALFSPEPTKVLKPNYVRLSPAVYEQIVLEAMYAKQSISDYISYLMYFKKVGIATLLFNTA